METLEFIVPAGRVGAQQLIAACLPVETPHFAVGTARMEAEDGLPMLHKDSVDLDGDAGEKSMDAYVALMEDSAEALRPGINVDLAAR